MWVNVNEVEATLTDYCSVKAYYWLLSLHTLTWHVKYDRQYTHTAESNCIRYMVCACVRNLVLSCRVQFNDNSVFWSEEYIAMSSIVAWQLPTMASLLSPYVSNAMLFNVRKIIRGHFQLSPNHARKTHRSVNTTRQDTNLVADTIH